MAYPFTVLGILAVRDVDDVLENDRRADDFVSRLRPHRIFRIGVEFPELLPGQRVVAAYPAVSLRMDGLNNAANVADGGSRPLTVQDPIFNRVVLPHQLAGCAIDGDDGRRLR